MSKKITKETLLKIKDEIMEFAKKNDLGKDFYIFVNNDVYGYELYHKKGSEYQYYYRKCHKKNVNPLDYCEYFDEKFILGMSYDGQMYEMINGYSGSGIYDKFINLFEKYDLYMEHSDSCHMELYPNGKIDIEDVEYTNYKKEVIHKVYREADAPDKTFGAVVGLWYAMSAAIGDQGSCVLGAALEMKYKGEKYRVSAQSPWQGSISWEKPVDVIKKVFELIGAEDIYYDAGRMD